MFAIVFIPKAPDTTVSLARLVSVVLLLAVLVGGGTYVWSAVTDGDSKPKPVVTAAEKDWREIRNSTSREELNAFIRKYSDSDFAKFALVRVQELSVEDEEEQSPADQASKDGDDTDDAVEKTVHSSNVTSDEPVRMAARTDEEEIEDPAAKEEEEDAFEDQPARVRELQRELVRVGCKSSGADGVWGGQSEDALEKFNKYTNSSLDTETPTQEALDIVKEKTHRVCPDFKAPAQNVAKPVEPKEVPAATKTPVKVHKKVHKNVHKKKLKARKNAHKRYKKQKAHKKAYSARHRKSKGNACTRCMDMHGAKNAVKAAMCQNVC